VTHIVRFRPLAGVGEPFFSRLLRLKIDKAIKSVPTKIGQEHKDRDGTLLGAARERRAKVGCEPGQAKLEFELLAAWF
jgi:hypothetical protein